MKSMSPADENPFSELNNFFDKIIVLSIKRNEHRIKILENSLKGLNFEIFIGVDGKTLDYDHLTATQKISDNINQIFVKTSFDYMNMKVEKIHINEIACAMSHKNIYEHILKNRFKRTLILEDDVIPVVNNLKFLNTTLKQLPSNWELFYLGYMINNDFSFLGRIKYHYLPNILHLLGFKTKNILRKKTFYPHNFSSNLMKNGGHTGTHAYAVTLHTAEKLFKMQSPLTFLADLLLMNTIEKKILFSYTSKFIFFEQNPNINSSIWNP